jgi:nitroreductase
MNNQEVTNLDRCFDEIVDFRFACKKFKKGEVISNEEIFKILEAGRLAPSSFGMEPWRFIIIENQNLKERLREACWNQPQLSDSSFVIAIVVEVERIQDPQEIAKNFIRRGLDSDATFKYINRYNDFISALPSVYEWGAKQCYLAAMEMMLKAASLKIDSCPIEGFEKDKVEMILDLNPPKEQIALIITFGYRDMPQSKRLRRDLREMIEWK